MASLIFGQFRPFRGFGILFLQCEAFPDRVGALWQKLAFLLFQSNEKRHASEIAGNEASSSRTAGATWQRDAASPDFFGENPDPEIGSSVLASRTWPKCGSTRRRFADKKSTPRIGFETAAKMNVQRKVRMPKFNVFRTEPHDGIDLPSAPESGGPEEGSDEV